MDTIFEVYDLQNLEFRLENLKFRIKRTTGTQASLKNYLMIMKK